MGCGQMVTCIQRVTSLSVFVDLDTVLGSFGVEERGVMRCPQGFEICSEGWTHLVEDLDMLAKQFLESPSRLQATYVRCASPHRVTS
jgi:hypothetical protein